MKHKLYGDTQSETKQHIGCYISVRDGIVCDTGSGIHECGQQYEAEKQFSSDIFFFAAEQKDNHSEPNDDQEGPPIIYVHYSLPILLCARSGLSSRLPIYYGC